MLEVEITSSNEKVIYDANGNITQLNRFGKNESNSFEKIDSLVYSYPANSNSLTGVVDYGNTALGFKDNGNNSDYTYYADGSTKTDANKGITNISYNYLGLEDEINFGSTKKIKNIYTTDGVKLAQYFINGTDTTKIEYIGDLIYRNNQLETIWHDEGRIKITETPFGGLGAKYQYFIQDHLGNNRVIFEALNASTYIAQRVDYYPFGAAISDSVSLPYLFQGKEWIDFNGYNAYDFGTRQYDPLTGRMLQIDGANQFASGYTGMGNNPVMGVDPDGQWVHIVIGAAVGGVVNLGIKAWQGKIHSFKDGAVAFGIGAVAGGVGAATGGLAFGAAPTGFLAVGGSSALGSVVSNPIQGFGNMAYFKDPYEFTAKGVIKDALISGLTAGTIGGIYSKAKGLNFWTGKPIAPKLTVTASGGDGNLSSNGDELVGEFSIEKQIELEFPNGYKQNFKYWNNGEQVGAFKVYQRDDIFEISDKNIWRMLNKYAPLDADGNPIQLHHLIQSDQGGLAEVTQKMHTEWSKILYINPNTIPSGINRAAFDIYRGNYWQIRALQIIKNQGLDAGKYMLWIKK